MSTRNARGGARTQRAQDTQRAHGKRPERPTRSTAVAGQVAEIQRARILGALVQVAGEVGAANVTVAHIVARAGISRRTFYEQFEDREACLLAALEEAIALASAAVLPAYQAPGRSGSRSTRWRECVRAGLAALLAFLDEEPGLGRLCVVEALGAGDAAQERRAQRIAALIAAVDEARAEIPAAKQPPPLTAEGVVGAVFAIVHARILARDAAAANGAPAPALSALTGELMGVIVLPYFGQAAAQKELHKPAPSLDEIKTRPRRDPLEGLAMRLTYRTVRVLMAVAAAPGASNRVLAEGSGISDQGQISKLLARLCALGLVDNTGEGYPRGAPNAWRLTARGAEVEGAIRLQSG
jgi:AcrR family transcriptional regulator